MNSKLTTEPDKTILCFEDDCVTVFGNTAILVNALFLVAATLFAISLAKKVM